MADPILTRIESAIKTLIEGMTTVGGYFYDWGTVNQPDEAKVTYPMALVELMPEEINLDPTDGAHAQLYRNDDMFRITCRHKLGAENAGPVFAINAVYNKMLDDLKRLFGNNPSLSDTCDIIMYRRAERINEISGDTFKPGRLVTEWLVRYTQDRLDPDTYGC